MSHVDRSGSMLSRSEGIPAQSMPLMAGTTEASTLWPQWNASSIDDPQMLARSHPYNTTWDVENTTSERQYPSSARHWGGNDTRQVGPAYVSPYPDVWQSPNERFPMPAPGNQVWQQPSPAFTDYQQLSPSRSDGSSSTYASSIPSPYPTGVPVIKLEDTPTSAPFSAQYGFGNAIHHTPTLAGSEFYTTSSAWSRKPFSTPMPSIGQQAEDVKQSYDSDYSHDIDSVRPGSNDPRMLNTNTTGRRGSPTPDTATIQCEICDKVFQRTNNLQTHMQVHDPERSHPHKCAFAGCGRGFVRKTDLARHEQSVGHAFSFSSAESQSASNPTDR